MAEVQDQRPKEWRRASGLDFGIFWYHCPQRILGLSGRSVSGSFTSSSGSDDVGRRVSIQSNSQSFTFETSVGNGNKNKNAQKGSKAYSLLQDSSTSRFAQALWGHFKKPTRPGMRSHSRCWFIESPNLLRGFNFMWFQAFGDWHVHNQFAYLTWFLSTRDFRFQAGWVRLEMGWAAGHIPRRSLELFTKKEATC